MQVPLAPSVSTSPHLGAAASALHHTSGPTGREMVVPRAPVLDPVYDLYTKCASSGSSGQARIGPRTREQQDQPRQRRRVIHGSGLDGPGSPHRAPAMSGTCFSMVRSEMQMRRRPTQNRKQNGCCCICRHSGVMGPPTNDTTLDCWNRKREIYGHTRASALTLGTHRRTSESARRASAPSTGRRSAKLRTC